MNALPRISRFTTLALASALVAALLLALAFTPRTAAAHPLGNFSINRLALIDLRADGTTSVRYILDIAEIPAFQEMDSVDPDGDGFVSAGEQNAYLAQKAPPLLKNIHMDAGGGRIDLALKSGSVELLPGQGGLDTLRIVLDLEGTLPAGWQSGARASFTDANYRGQVGWRQIVVLPGDGVDLFQTSAALEDVTSELTAYPQDLLKSPPSVDGVSFDFRAGETTLTAPVSGASNTVSRDAAQRTLGRFASLVETERLTLPFLALALLLSAGWGAMHALGPGHGKTIVAAYLVGERGTGRHALFLGFVVTATHTISVFALGLIALFASDILSAEDVYFWLSLASGVLVSLLGAALLLGRLRRLLAARKPARAHHEHTPGHHSHTHEEHEHTHDEHAHDHGHSPLPQAPGWRGLLALGVSGGIVPCPTALVVMLGAIAVHRTLYGLALVVAFSTGLAGVLTGIGLLLVYGRSFFDGRAFGAALTRRSVFRRISLVSPVLSALAILGLGLVLTGRAML